MKSRIPICSPCGAVDHYDSLCPGIYSVSTPSHGGIMADTATAIRVSSDKALACFFRENGYACFEEDCNAPAALRELMDRGLYQAPVNEYWKPGEYTAAIDNSIKRWHPEY